MLFLNLNIKFLTFMSFYVLAILQNSAKGCLSLYFCKRPFKTIRTFTYTNLAPLGQHEKIKFLSRKQKAANTISNSVSITKSII